MGHKTTGLNPLMPDMTAGLPGSVAPFIAASCVDSKTYVDGKKGGAAMQTLQQIKRSYIKIKQQSVFEWICETLLEFFYLSIMLGGIILALYWVIKNI